MLRDLPSERIVSAFERSWGDGGKAVEEYNVRQVFMNRVCFACDKYTDAINQGASFNHRVQLKTSSFRLLAAIGASACLMGNAL